MKILMSSTNGVRIALVIGMLGTLLALEHYPFTWTMALTIIIGYFAYGCLGIVVTYHRGLTHQSYKMRPLLTKILTLLGALSCTGSAIAWSAIHINHHLKSDKPLDPHSPKYQGWKIFLLEYNNSIDKNTKWRMRNLITDSFQQFVHRFYFAIIIVWSLCLFLLGGFWLMIFAHWAPAVVTALMSNIVNLAGHKPNWVGGSRTYPLPDESTNTWLFAIPSFGESWHNNHHRWPKRYRFAEKWYQIDIAAEVIKLIQKPV